MSRFITFSRTFPAYHPRAGQPTYFVEKIYNSIYKQKTGDWSDALGDTSSYVVELDHLQKETKHQTIRAGHRFKPGDMFSPRVWGNDINPKTGRSGPYHSKHIIIAPDIEVKKTCDFDIKVDGDYKCIMIDNWPFYEENGRFITQVQALETLCKNDGLSVEDFKAWFKWGKPFTGQIICWNDTITY